MQTYDNTGSTHLRYDELTQTGVKLSWFRDTGSSTGSTNTENVGYIAFESDGELTASNTYCSSLPFAEDKELKTYQGTVETLLLLPPEYSTKVAVVITSLPFRGSLYQYTANQDLSETNLIKTPDTKLVDLRVLYKSDLISGEDSSDFFQFKYLSPTGTSSNTAVVTVYIKQKSSGPVSPIPQNPSSTPISTPLDNNNNNNNNQSDLQRMNSTMTALLVLAFIIVILLAAALTAMAFFFYKKKTARKEMISMFLGENELGGRGTEQTYFPEEINNSEDSAFEL